MAPRRRLSSPFARWLLGLMVVATCVLAGALGAGAVAAAGVQPGDAQHRTAGIARAADTPSQRTARLRAALRGLHESVVILEDGVMHSGGRELAALNAVVPRFGPATRALLDETRADYAKLVEASRRR